MATQIIRHGHRPIKIVHPRAWTREIPAPTKSHHWQLWLAAAILVGGTAWFAAQLVMSVGASWLTLAALIIGSVWGIVLFAGLSPMALGALGIPLIAASIFRFLQRPEREPDSEALTLEPAQV